MIRIGTRGSVLARAQSTKVADLLARSGHPTRTVMISTAGDQHVEREFKDIGPVGVFVAELENALLGGRVDVAVHSYKDLPSTGPVDLVVAAVPERLDAADRLIARPESLAGTDDLLPLLPRTVVGTASARRQALLRSLHPRLEVRSLRGNVPTRLLRLRQGGYGAIVLASAGLLRLDEALALQRPKDDRTAIRGDDGPPAHRRGLVERRLDPSVFVPAPAQGAIALQVRRRDRKLRELLSALHDRRAGRAVSAERELLARVQGGCELPFGAWCRCLSNGALEMVAALEIDGQIVTVSGQGTEPDELAANLWEGLYQPSGLRA